MLNLRFFIVTFDIFIYDTLFLQNWRELVFMIPKPNFRNGFYL